LKKTVNSILKKRVTLNPVNDKEVRVLNVIETLENFKNLSTQTPYTQLFSLSL